MSNDIAEFKKTSALKIFLCIAAGIAVAQLISSIDLFQSNREVAQRVHLLSQAGHATVPTGSALKSLYKISSAVGGALFLSLTAGTAVSTVSTVLLFLCISVLKVRKRATLKYSALIKYLLIYFLIWSLITILIIVTREIFFTAAYTFFIPLVTSSLFIAFSLNREQRVPEKSGDPESNQDAAKIRTNFQIALIIIIVIVSLSITALFYHFRCDKSLFLRVRDYILLASRPGEQLSSFYYTYTLYAAEAVKPPEHREIYTSQQRNSQLILSSDNRDNHRIIRLLCFAGLTVVVPILLYLSFFLLFLWLIQLLIDLCFIRIITANKQRLLISEIISGVTVAGLSILLLYYVYPLPIADNQPTESNMQIKAMLQHSDYRMRIEGLRKLCAKGNLYSNGDKKEIKNGDKDTIWSYPEAISNAVNHGEIAEKYWLANAFASAKEVAALPYLEKLIDDPSINVQCAAIKALGAIGMVRSASDSKQPVYKSRVIHLLQNRMADSSEWYVQKSAYSALKKVKTM